MGPGMGGGSRAGTRCGFQCKAPKIFREMPLDGPGGGPRDLEKKPGSVQRVVLPIHPSPTGFPRFPFSPAICPKQILPMVWSSPPHLGTPSLRPTNTKQTTPKMKTGIIPPKQKLQNCWLYMKITGGQPRQGRGRISSRHSLFLGIWIHLLLDKCGVGEICFDKMHHRAGVCAFCSHPPVHSHVLETKVFKRNSVYGPSPPPSVNACNPQSLTQGMGGGGCIPPDDVCVGQESIRTWKCGPAAAHNLLDSVGLSQFPKEKDISSRFFFIMERFASDFPKKNPECLDQGVALLKGPV